MAVQRGLDLAQIASSAPRQIGERAVVERVLA
jgi:hypothetical protein